MPYMFYSYISLPFSRRLRRSLLILLCMATAVFSAGCRSGDTPEQRTDAGGEQVTPVDSASIRVRYARGFDVQQYKAFTLLKVFNPFQERADTLRYLLVGRDEPLPRSYPFPQAQVIRTPVQRMIATSTTHIALTGMLDAQQVIVGMVGARYAYDPEIRRRLASGQITPFSQGEFNNEVALNINPDLLMISAGQASQYDNYRLLADAGIGVLVNAEWLETTPLGKAEWVKVMGLLVEQQEEAVRRFRRVADAYEALTAKAAQRRERPLVITNMPYQGAWFVPGGDSFTAQFLKDAGAGYPWDENESTGGLRLDFETVYEAGLRADVWINPGTASSRADILAADSRFSDFKSYKNGRIYNNNKRMSAAGGNDFWERGVVRPDLILSDLIAIFHPGMAPRDSLYFYQKVD